MYSPTTRVLTVLELLQTHGKLSGPELANRLGVDGRTLRRYIGKLEDLGIPVTAERGRYGSYSLIRGFKLPPMMFTEDEAMALSVGLLAARQLGLAEAALAVESAQAKLERVMPAALKNRLRALTETVTLDMRVSPFASDNAALLTLSTAAHAHQRVHLHYRSLQGDDTERDFDPYGLAWRGGRWYVVGHCHLRGATRISHELNQPLTAAMGTLEMLELRRDLPPDVTPRLKRAYAQLERMAQLARELGELTQPTASRHYRALSASRCC